MKAHLLNSKLTRVLLITSMTMLVANSALAHKHRHHHHAHTEVLVYEQARYIEDDYDTYGRVMNARPIYQSVAVDVPQESCHVETVAREERYRNGNSVGSTIVGGLVGAAIGHNIGHGHGEATAVGGLIGAAIGNDASRGSRVVSYRDREVCGTNYRTEYENRIVGYDVSYRYQGRIYQTRTDRHPGDRIPVNVRYSNDRY